MDKLMARKFEEGDFSSLFRVCEIRNQLGMSMACFTESDCKEGETPITKIISELNSLAIINPSAVEECILLSTHYPSFTEANLIVEVKRISTVVVKYPLENLDGLIVLAGNNIDVVSTAISIDDIIVANENVVLKRVDLDQRSKSGLYIPDEAILMKARGIVAEVISCDKNEDFKEGDIVLVDIISCQWLTLVNAENSREEKFFLTITKEILGKF